LEEIDTLFAKDEILDRLGHHQDEKDVVKQEIENVS
jgi:hypothetical protein